MAQRTTGNRVPRFKSFLFVMTLSLLSAEYSPAQPFFPDSDAARRQAATADSVLAPVYDPLAAWIVSRLDLAGSEGIGVDIGGGPGSLAVALSLRTPRMHWINADLNPASLPLAVERARTAGVSGRLSAIAADVHALPFHDGYADVFVSRGSLQQWDDLRRGFREILRVLKPGGAAFIGRGFPEGFPSETARSIRERQRGGFPAYDPKQTAAELESILKELGVSDYTIHLPRPEGAESILYGVWAEFRKDGGQPRAAVAAETPAETAVDSFPVIEPVEVRAVYRRDPLADPLAEPAGLTVARSTVTRAEIEARGADTVVDAMTYLPGAWTQTRGRKVKQFVSFRGQTYPYPEYAVNGALFREFHELPFLLSTGGIERIEVMRSSASLLTGLAGMAGVINLVPRIYTAPETSVGMEVGSFGTWRARLAHGNGSERFSYSVHLDAPQTEGPEGRYAAESVTNAGLNLHWLPRRNITVEAGAYHLYGEHRLAQALPPAQARLQETRERYDPVRADVAYLKAVMRHSPSSTTEALVSWSDRDNDFVADTDSSTSTTREWDFEYAANIIHSRSLSTNNTLRIGGHYNRWVAPRGKRFFTGRRCDLETFSAAASDEHRFGRLLLDGGVQVMRTYVHDYGAFNIEGTATGFGKVAPVTDEWEDPVVNAAIGAAYALTSTVSLHGNAALGRVEPRPGTLDTDRLEPDSERRLKLDAGIRFSCPDLGSAVVTGFLVRQDEAIVLSGGTATVNGRVLELYENRDQRQTGIELELNSPLIRNALRLFATGTAMRPRAEQNGEMRTNEEMPKYITSGGVNFARRGVDLSALWKYVSGYESARFAAPGKGMQPLGDFHDLTLSAGYSFGQSRKARVFVEAHNLLDKEYSTVVGYPDFGRRWTMGFNRAF